MNKKRIYLTWAQKKKTRGKKGRSDYFISLSHQNSKSGTLKPTKNTSSISLKEWTKQNKKFITKRT